VTVVWEFRGSGGYRLAGRRDKNNTEIFGCQVII